MRLTLAIHPVSEVKFGGATRLDGSTLSVNEDDLRAFLLEDERLESIDIDIVSKGDPVRIGGVFDIVEPRAKEPADGSDFPGVVGPMRFAGRGTSHALRGAAVTVVGEGMQNVVEMSGPWSEWCPYAALQHVVLAPHARTDLPRHVAIAIRRLAAMKTAAYLGRTALGQTPDSTEVYESIGPADPNFEQLPRIAYIGQIHSRQQVAEVDEQIFYGHNTIGLLPTLLHPNEWLDGAILRSNAGIAIETYFYQNNPIIKELYRWHDEGKIRLVGTIATTAAVANFDRDLNCHMAAEMAKWNLAADGVVLTKTGGGAPHADMGFTAQLCEHLGMRTVVMMGPPDSANDRTVESLTLFNEPEVDAIVSNNGGSFYELPAARVERVIGPSPAAAEAFFAMTSLPGARVCGVTNQQGAQRFANLVY